MIEIQLPVSEEVVRKLKVGDEVVVSGVMITARDAAHKYLLEEDAAEVREILSGGMIYHCGPVVKKDETGWHFVAAGPTTSEREEPYQAAIIAKYEVRGVIGKGGMGPGTLSACQQHGAVYLHAIGGLAVILGRAVKKVRAVHKLEEFGSPEAMWEIEVERFPAVVTMDSHGQSLHQEIRERSSAVAQRLRAGL